MGRRADAHTTRVARAHRGVRENSTDATIRAQWSGKETDDQQQSWVAFHRRLVHHADSFFAASSVSPLVLLGDSITERLRLTRNGKPLSQADVDQLGLEGLGQLVNSSSFVTRWGAPLFLGIGGDQTQHLLWRLGDGELSTRSCPPDRCAPLISLLIGTNNLGWGHTPREVAAGVAAVARLILGRHRRARLLVTEILPRENLNPWPPPLSGQRTLREAAVEAVREANALIRHELRGKFGEGRASGRLRLADCGEPFRSLSPELLPDGLHPSTAGYRTLFQCWESHVAVLAASQAPQQFHEHR